MSPLATNEWPPLPRGSEMLPVLHHPCGYREVGYPGTRRHGPSNCADCRRIRKRKEEIYSPENIRRAIELAKRAGQ